MGAAFPIRKDALIKQVQDAVAMVSASRVGSYTAMLQKSTQELARRHGDESDCPHDSTTLQDEIAELVAAGDAMMERAKKCKEATIDIMEEDTQKYEAKINALGDKVKEFVEAVGYKTSCKINEARAQYQKKYWQVTKIAQHLVEGSHTTSVAKIFSEQISQQMGGMNTEDWLPGGDGAMFAVNPVFAEFTGDLPAWWNEASMVARAFADVLVKLEDAIRIKEDALLQKLGEEQKWHGVVGDVSGCSLDLAHVPFKNGLDTFVEADHVGAQPWLAAMKKNTRRHGPTAVPSPGVPMLIVPRKSLFVHCYPCEALCEKGIPLQNYEHYLATPDGCIDVKKLGVMALVNKGCLFYIPAGFVVHLVFYGAQEKKAKNLDIEMASCILAPLPFKKKLDLLSKNAKSALLSWHKSSTKDKKPPCGWSARSSLAQCSVSVE